MIPPVADWQHVAHFKLDDKICSGFCLLYALDATGAKSMEGI